MTTATTKSAKIDGVIVTLCLTVDEGLSIADGGKWVLMCKTHGGIVQDTNKVRLWKNRFDVLDWCEECQDSVKAGA